MLRKLAIFDGGFDHRSAIEIFLVRSPCCCENATISTPPQPRPIGNGEVGVEPSMVRGVVLKDGTMERGCQ